MASILNRAGSRSLVFETKQSLRSIPGSLLSLRSVALKPFRTTICAAGALLTARRSTSGLGRANGVVCQAGRSTGEWWKKDNPPNMRDINSIQELVDALSDAGDRLVIVEFYAQWCNACRALFPKICKIMAENPDVLFLKVNFDDNRDACRTLSVKVLPYFHFYRGAEGRVAAFSATISKLQLFKDAVETYSAAFCSLEPAPGLAEFPDLIAHPELHPEEAAEAARRARLASTESEEELHPLADTPTVVG
ncbi:hypothetical protein CHLRE_03g157800v5 [Chlamydomonas reinhardtii]|uniref:Uncharacterized protein n=1 Tax=Chlamydomonas reinhardtii TaxID=3055 RepID=A8J7H6_CHLRE|nr:uncharacterized protein CHLRE_03g157800v5 [Chlamydomonas reinhardtii]PNW84767.1 hypothetical protein CHLRE_03g157800v5 [Chlamydomonas reinhardtii]|eukprot:XP_001697443.1 thioredoxin-like protein [Chlamydomonas reinhardtii]